MLFLAVAMTVAWSFIIQTARHHPYWFAGLLAPRP